MKKFLAVLLAVMMVFSTVVTMIVSVGAVATVASDTPNSILVSDGTDAAEEFYNPAKPGWSLTNNGNNDNTYKVVDVVTGKETEKAVGDVITGPATFPVIGYRFHYWAAETLDISGMKYVEFDLYLSDATAYQGKTMIVELASGGIDNDEISFEAKYPLVNGWNHIRLNIEDNFTGKLGNFNKTAWKFLRVFFNSEEKVTVEEGEEMILAIDNLEFNNGRENGNAEVAPHKITMSNCNAKVDGWEWPGDASLKSPNGENNTGSIAKTWLPGSKIGFAEILNFYDMDSIGGETPDHADTTGATKFIFDFYTSSADLIKGLNFVIELTSGGNCDVEEICWANVKLGSYIEGGLKTGWNTIVLTIADASGSGYRPENWNWFRMFYNDRNTFVVPDGLTLAFDNVRFENDNGEVVYNVSDCNPDTKGWGGSAGAINIPKETGTDEETGDPIMTMQAAMGSVHTSNITGAGDLNFMYVTPKNGAFNITGMKYLEFDFYISDAKAFSNSEGLCIELGSEGICDQSEIAYKVYKNGASLGLKDGWNHVQIPLSLFTEKTNGSTGAFQPTHLNWFRMYNEGNIPVDGELTVAIDNVTFWDGLDNLKLNGRGDAVQDRETITVATGADIIEFTVANYETAKGAIFSAELSGAVALEVSTDGENWSEVYKFEDTKSGNALSKAVRAYTLTDYVVDEDGLMLGNTIYVKVVGGTIGAEATLSVVYDIPEFEDTDNYTFTVGTAAEETYLVEAGSINDEKSVRFADGNNKVVYKYDLKRTNSFESLSWSAGIQGQYVISASTDGQNWTEVLRWDNTEGGEHGPTTAAPKLIDLSGAIDLSGTVESVYIMITDAVTTDGWGGAVTNTQPTILSAKYFDAASMKHDKTSFTVLKDDADYLSQNTAGEASGPSRYADQTKTFTYKYSVTGVDGIKSITWTAPISAQYLVKASADGENWIEIGKSEAQAAKEVRSFNASALAAAVEKSKTLYIQIGDAVATDGNGGRVWSDSAVVLDVAYIPLTDAQKDALEMTGDEHTVPLHGCNSTWSDPAFVLDYENATAGSACITVEMKKGVISSTNLASPVDATGMDTLEFELYLSDLAILDDIKFGSGDSIEITSGGTADKGEKNYDLSRIFDKLKADGNAVVGWNHIAIKLTDMGETDTSGTTPFDISAINYIRIFWVSATMPSDADKYTIKFDNFRFTDAQAQAVIQNQKDKEAFDANYADLVAALKALGNYNTSSSVTKDNYEAVKAEIAAVKAQVAALSEKDQKIADEVGYLNYLEKAENSVSKYEKDLEKKVQAMEANKAVVDAINALTTEITDANYESVKAAVEAARAAYDAMDRSVKKYFTEDGLTDKLEAAEAAVKAFTPGGSGTTTTPGTTDCTEHVDNDGDKKCDNCAAKMGGCGSVLTIGAVATMVLAGAWVTIAARKRED